MSPSSNHEQLNAESLDLTGIRILLVEDSWNVGVALKTLLRALGAEVIGPAATTADAERLIAQQIPDVGIVDYNLRGGEMAHGLIDNMNTQGIRVIVLSGYSTVPLSPGKAVSVLQKPTHGPGRWSSSIMGPQDRMMGAEPLGQQHFDLVAN